MQKIKNENGITMITLVITIIVLIILAVTSFNIGAESLNATRNNRLEAELEMVQQITISEYTKAKQLGYIEQTSVMPPNFVGKKLSVSELPNDVTWQITEDPTEQYKAYYEVTPQDLEKLEIANSEYSYIVNYYTGEVFNKTKRATSTGELLYINATTNIHREKETDTESFNDW